jgi:hypothetical protein
MNLEQFNTHIANKGIKAELVEGEGYFYFVGEDVDLAKTTSVYVYAFDHLSLSQWETELRVIMAEHADFQARQFKDNI